MKKEEKEKLENKLKKIDEEIQLKESEIKNSPPYLLEEEIIKENYSKLNSIEKEIRTLKNEVYNKYIGGFYWGRGFNVGDIKPTIKQGIKRGLGVKSLEEINTHLVTIVKELIAKELDTPQIKELMNKGAELNEELNKLRFKRDKILLDGVQILKQKKRRLMKTLTQEADREGYKLKKKKAEAKTKFNNLPKYIEKITKEVNRGLMLDSLKGDKN